MEVIHIFQPVLSLGARVGIVRPEVDPKSRWLMLKNVLLWIQFLVTQVFIWFIAVKLIVPLSLEDSDVRGLAICSLFIFFFGTAFMTLTTYISFWKQFPAFCKAFDKYRREYGVKEFYFWMHNQRRVRQCCYVFVVLSILVTASITAYFYMERGTLTSIFYPFNFDNLFMTILSLTFSGVFLFVTLVQQIAVGFLFISITFLFIGEFRNINMKLRSAIEIPSKCTAPVIEGIRQQFTDLLICFERSKILFRHYLFTIYAVTVPVVCFFLYAVIRHSLQPAEIMTVSIGAVLNSSAVVVYTLISAVLHTKAHEALEPLTQLDLLQVPEKSIQSIMMFLTRLTGPPIGYTIYDMMTLDNGAILQLFGTLVTYAVVMLQFSGAQLPTMDNNCNNTIS